MARPVGRWLETFMCGHYVDIFEACGYKTLQSVCQLDIHQLRSMGVMPEHVDKIMENVSVLRQSYMAKGSDNATMAARSPYNPPAPPVDPVMGPASSALACVARQATVHGHNLGGNMGNFGDVRNPGPLTRPNYMNDMPQNNYPNSQSNAGMAGTMPPYPGNQPNVYNRGPADPNRIWPGPQMQMANGPPRMAPPNGPQSQPAGGYNNNMYNMAPNVQQQQQSNNVPQQQQQQQQQQQRPMQHNVDNPYHSGGGDMSQYPGQGPGLRPTGPPPSMHPPPAPGPGGVRGPSSGGFPPTGSQPPPDRSMGPPPSGMPPQGQGMQSGMPPQGQGMQQGQNMTGMMSQGPVSGVPPTYNQQNHPGMPFGSGDHSGVMPGGGPRGPQIYQSGMTGPMHPHLRNQPQNPQQVADSILQMASGNYNNPNVSRYRQPIPLNQQQGGPPMHSPQMMQTQYRGPRPQQPGGGQFVYPNNNQMPAQSNASPMSPMQVQSPASMHSNASLPSSSPGPLRSPVPPGMPHNPSPGLPNLRSPTPSTGLHPQQPMGNHHHAQQQPMTSPISMSSGVSPVHPGSGSQGQLSPASTSTPICSPPNHHQMSHQQGTPVGSGMYNNQQDNSASYQMNSMSSVSSQSSPSGYSTCSQQQQQHPHPQQGMMSAQGPGPPPAGLQHHPAVGHPHSMGHPRPPQPPMYPQHQAPPSHMPNNCPSTSGSNTHFPSPSSSSVFTSPSPTSFTHNTNSNAQLQAHHSAAGTSSGGSGIVNPLQSLQKLVMLPESQVVDPKSVVNDACLPNSNGEDILSSPLGTKNEDGISKNLNDELRNNQADSQHHLGSSKPEGLSANEVNCNETSRSASLHSNTAGSECAQEQQDYTKKDNEQGSNNQSCGINEIGSPLKNQKHPDNDEPDDGAKCFSDTAKSPKRKGKRKRKSEEEKSGVVNGCMDGDFMSKEIKSPRKILQTANSLAAILNDDTEVVLGEEKCDSNSKRDDKRDNDSNDNGQSVHYVMSDLQVDSDQLPEHNKVVRGSSSSDKLELPDIDRSKPELEKSKDFLNCGRDSKNELTLKERKNKTSPKTLINRDEYKISADQCNDDNKNSIDLPFPTKVNHVNLNDKSEKGLSNNQIKKEPDIEKNTKDENKLKGENSVCERLDDSDGENNDLEDESIHHKPKKGIKKNALKKKLECNINSCEEKKSSEEDDSPYNVKKKSPKRRKSVGSRDLKSPEKDIKSGSSSSKSPQPKLATSKSPSDSGNCAKSPDSVFVTPEKVSPDSVKSSPNRKRSKKCSGETSSSISDDSLANNEISLTTSELTDGTKDVPASVKRKRRKRKSSEISRKSSERSVHSDTASQIALNQIDISQSEQGNDGEEASQSESWRGYGSQDEEKNCQLEMEVECIEEPTDNYNVCNDDEENVGINHLEGMSSGRRRRKQTVMPNFVGLDEDWGDSDDDDDFRPQEKLKKTSKKSDSFKASSTLTQSVTSKKVGGEGKKSKKTPSKSSKGKVDDCEVKMEFEELSIKIAPDSPEIMPLAIDSSLSISPQPSTSKPPSVKSRSANSSPRARKKPEASEGVKANNKNKKRKIKKNSRKGPGGTSGGLLAIDSDNETTVGRLDLKNAIKVATAKNKSKKSSRSKDEHAHNRPVVRIKGTREHPTSVEVINSQDAGDAERTSKHKSRSHGNEVQSERNANTLTYPMSDTVPWICAFCSKSTNYSILGDLFGPYFLENTTNSSGSLTSPGAFGASSSEAESEQVGSRKKGKTSSRRNPSTGSTSATACSGRESKRRRWASKEAMLHSPTGGKAHAHHNPSSSPTGVPQEVWFHEDCVTWCHGVYLAASRVHGLDEAIAVAKQTTCSVCRHVGATLGCFSKGCSLKYHYLCAVEKDCSFDEENFSLFCPKHKERKIKMMSGT